MTRLTAFLLAIAAIAAPPAEMAPFAPLLGNWNATITNALTGEIDHHEVSRYWSPHDPYFLLESNMRDGDELVFCALTYDPRRERYRGLRCGPRGSLSFQASWDPATRSLIADTIGNNRSVGRFQLTIGDEIRWRLTVRSSQGRLVFDSSGVEKRQAPTKLQRIRKAEVDLLRHFTGAWESQLTAEGEGKPIISNSVAHWSRQGQGDFLLTQEADKITMTTWNPHARRYHGAFLERSGAGFFFADWEPGEKRFTQRFYAYDLPQDEHGRPLPGAAFTDGIHGEIVERFRHNMHSDLHMTVRFAGATVWQGKGERKRHIDPKRVWSMQLDSHPDQGLVFDRGFRHGHGLGENASLGPADQATAVFFHNGQLRKFGRWGLCLNVSRNNFEAGNPVNLWRNFNSLDGQHRWRINPDKTLSPAQAPELVLGWSQRLVLVPAKHADRLVFTIPIPQQTDDY